MKNLGKLGVGSMSPFIVEAVFSYSQSIGEPLMLVASKNQIDWDGGYCGNWTTAQYVKVIKELKGKYLKAQVYLCRDHCGPGFKNDDLKDVYRTIDDDIKNGFDLIHVDFCRLKGNHQNILSQSKKAVKYILAKQPDMMLETGTDENTGKFKKDIRRVEEQMKFFTALAPVQFFVTQTGSLVKEINQAGSFNQTYVKKLRQIADRHHLKLKEHNCDYIKAEDLEKRRGLIDAVNVAPQYGVIQTLITLQKANTYGIDATDFLNAAYESKKWRKWLKNNTLDNKYLCSIIAGHYVFADPSYQRLVEKINKQEDLKQIIITELSKNFDMYLRNI